MPTLRRRKRPYVVLACGDREWNNLAIIRREFKQLKKKHVRIRLVHGACRGADEQCGYVGNKLGFDVIPYPADWDTYGRGAGPIRNGEMLEKENPDEVIAFHKNIKRSRGTKNIITQAQAAGVPTKVVDK